MLETLKKTVNFVRGRHGILSTEFFQTEEITGDKYDRRQVIFGSLILFQGLSHFTELGSH